MLAQEVVEGLRLRCCAELQVQHQVPRVTGGLPDGVAADAGPRAGAGEAVECPPPDFVVADRVLYAQGSHRCSFR